MTLDQQNKLAAHLQRLLKVRNISFPIARTEKGELSIKYTKDQEGYELILDAVPLDQKDYDNRELKLLLEKYLFEMDERPLIEAEMKKLEGKSLAELEAMIPEKKKPGRPRKQK